MSRSVYHDENSTRRPTSGLRPSVPPPPIDLRFAPEEDPGAEREWVTELRGEQQGVGRKETKAPTRSAAEITPEWLAQKRQEILNPEQHERLLLEILGKKKSGEKPSRPPESAPPREADSGFSGRRFR